MHVFISAGEPSGDLHGANLARALLSRHPGIKLVGYGGEKMASAGVDIHYPLTKLAVMWFGKIASHLLTFYRLAARARNYFDVAKPDAVVLIDYPGFHWHLAKRARKAGIPVYYFVPPQLWAWAGWRVKKVKRNFTAVLTAMSFEEDWYHARGVRTQYIGHPYFDELATRSIDSAFLDAERSNPGPVVALLPGSRNQEISANGPIMIEAARRIRARRPDTRFLIAAFNDDQAAVVRNLAFMAGIPVDIHVGRTPEIIDLATCCVAVSGSVGLELLDKAKPTVVVYKVTPTEMWIGRQFRTCKYISLVNLLAGEELFPEFLTAKDESTAIADRVTGWLTDDTDRKAVESKLRELKARVAIPGACDRAAEFLLGELDARTKSSRRLAA
ncbi:MAG TPA: lipid-A-disaccharide synthase [Fimbriiglobus sp.]|jgi:lipid-A-disaccharide synthase